jgi:ABC-2 type transport system ATP-binding protein
MLRIENISKGYQQQQVLVDISLEIQAGTIFALVGPNGAGKTTLLRIIMGIIFPDQGRVLLHDEDLLKNHHLKQRVAYIPETHHLYPNFTGKQLAEFFRLTFKTWDEGRYQELKQEFSLPENKKFKSLSKGMKTQMAFLLNLSLHPELLILDEPTAGADPMVSKRVLNAIVDEVASQGTTVVISSHNLLELERICDSFGIISQGKVLLNQRVENFKQEIYKVQVAFTEDMPEAVAEHPGLLSIKQVGKIYTLVIRDSQLLNLIKANQPVFFEALDISMEEIFLSVLGGYGNDQ